MLRCSRLVIAFVLLFITPSLILCPHGTVPVIQSTIQEAPLPESSPQLTYDGILALIYSVENEQLEATCGEEQLEKITQFIAMLAQQGAPQNDPDAALILQYDIQELLYGEDQSGDYFLTFHRGGDAIIAPVTSYGKVVLCKGWVKKTCQKIAKFAKKHKKALIIGAIVVTAVAAIATAVILSGAAASTAAEAATAAAGAGAGAAVAADKKERKKQRSSSAPERSTSEITTADTASLIKAALEEHIPAFKKELEAFEDARYPSAHQNFEEKARESGSHLAHQTFDAISHPEEVIAIHDIPAASFDERPSSHALYENLRAKEHKKHESSSAPEITAADTAPVIKDALEKFQKQSEEFNDASYASTDANQTLPSSEHSTFIEGARQVGARIAHEIYYYKLDANAPYLALLQVLGFRDRVLSEILSPNAPLPDFQELPFSIEQLEEWIAAGHEKIDEVFSTHLAKEYTLEAQEARSKKSPFNLIPFPSKVLAKTLKRIGYKAVKKGLRTASQSLGCVAKKGRILATQTSSEIGWKVGEPYTNLTKKGNLPKWSTVRKRYWKNRVEWTKANPSQLEYTSRDIERMQEGLAPQRFNKKVEQWESKELHHNPAQKDGGLFDFVEAWPDEHDEMHRKMLLEGK